MCPVRNIRFVKCEKREPVTSAYECFCKQGPRCTWSCNRFITIFLCIYFICFHLHSKTVLWRRNLKWDCSDGGVTISRGHIIPITLCFHCFYILNIHWFETSQIVVIFIIVPSECLCECQERSILGQETRVALVRDMGILSECAVIRILKYCVISSHESLHRTQETSWIFICSRVYSQCPRIYTGKIDRWGVTSLNKFCIPVPFRRFLS